MKPLSLLTTVAVAAFFFTACKNQGTTGLPVPKDAAMVVHINGASLSSKLSWKEIQATEWFKEMHEKSIDRKDSLQQKIMDDPANSGIDIKSDFVFFLRPHGKSGQIVFEGNLKNADDFEAMVKKEKDNDKQIVKDGDLKYIKDGRSSVMSWTKSKFIFMADAPFNQSYSMDDYDKPAKSDSLLGFVKSLLDLKKSDGLEDNDHFTSLLKESGDLHFWMNMESYYSLIGSTMERNPVGSMLTNMNRFFKGTISTGTMSFDDGKITVKTKQYMGEEMKKVMDKFTFHPVTKDMVNRIPSQNVVGALVANYPPEASKEILKATGLDGFVNMYLGKINYSLDELVQATKGQIVLAATDFSIVTQQVTVPGTNYSYPSTKPDIKVLLGISINNKASFDKLISIAEAQLKDSSEKEAILSKISYKTNNDWFAVSNSPESVQQFLAGGNNNLPFADRISGHPYGAYIDIQKILKGVPASEGMMSDIMSVSMNTWQDIVVIGGDYKDGATTGELTVNMVDKKTNSLKQLNQYAENIYKSQKKREAEMNNQPDTDSVRVVPPAQ